MIDKYKGTANTSEHIKTKLSGLTSAKNTLFGTISDLQYWYVPDNAAADPQKRDIRYLWEHKEMTTARGLVYAWKNDKVFSQITVYTLNRPARQVKLDATDFTSAKSTIPAANVAVSYIGYTSIEKGNPTGIREDIPDIITDYTVNDFEPYSLYNIWVSFETPKDIPAGIYQGNIYVTAEDQEQLTFHYQIEVADFVRPDVEDWEFHLDLWQNPYAIARVSGISEAELFTRKHLDAMLPYYKMLRDAGQDVITTTIIKDPWNSQTDDPYDAMVKTTLQPDGTYCFDYTDFDTYVEFMINEVGIRKQINCYSILPWENRFFYYDEEKGAEHQDSPSVGSRKWTEFWSAMMNSLVGHLEEKGWLDITYVAFDEREYGDVRKALELIKNVSGGKLKISAAFINLSNDLNDFVEDASVHMFMVENSKTPFRSVARERSRQGKITAMYTNGFNYFSPLENAWYILNCYDSGANGYLRWAYDSFVPDAVADADHRVFQAGDCFFVYPEAFSSVRFEALSKGMSDVVKIQALCMAEPSRTAWFAEHIKLAKVGSRSNYSADVINCSRLIEEASK